MALPSRSLLLLSALLHGGDGCSYVELPVPDAKAVNGTSFVIGRTMELGNDGARKGLWFPDAFWQVHVHPRGTWGPLGFVSVDETLANRTVTSIDEGMNEAGLTVSAQTLRESEYEQVQAGDSAADVVTFPELLPSLLGACANVSQALDWLEGHRVVSAPGYGKSHWALADASGRSVVVEYLRGRRVVFENTPRVMTNDPPLDWQWRNLNTYVNLNPAFPHQNDFMAVETSVGAVPRAVGHGWNLFGLPGDGSPPSRFVQLFYQRGYCMRTAPPKSVDDAMVLATGLLNKVFIPLGTFAADGEATGDSPEYTPYAVLKVPFQKEFLFRGYRNLMWKRLNLNHIDFDVEPSKAPSWVIDGDGSMGIEDLNGPSATRMV